MNNARRKRIAAIRAKLEAILVEIDVELEGEQEYLDGMPEAFQSGQKGEAAQVAIDALQEASDQVSSALQALETAGE